MIASLFQSVKSVNPQPFAATWDELCALLSQHAERSTKQSGTLWSPAIYADGAKRGLAGVDVVAVFVADLDGEALDAVVPRLAGIDWIAVTTWSHRDDDPHWHLVIRLDRAVDACDWSATWRAMHQQFGITGDPQTCDASRIYYTPQHAPGEAWQVVRGVGAAVSVDSLPGVPDSQRGVRRSAKRATSNGREWMDEAWWNEPADLSRFDGMTERETLHALHAELRVLSAQILADLDAENT